MRNTIITLAAIIGLAAITIQLLIAPIAQDIRARQAARHCDAIVKVISDGPEQFKEITLTADNRYCIRK